MVCRSARTAAPTLWGVNLALPGVSRTRHIWGEIGREFAAALIGALVLASVASNEGVAHDHLWVWIDAGLGVLSLVLVLFRRRYPLLVCVVVSALTAVSGAASGAAALALVSLATRRKWRPVAVASAVLLVAGLVFEMLTRGAHDDLGDWITNVVLGLLSIALCVVSGLAIGSRRLLVENLQTRLIEAEHSQQMRVEQARVAERGRIAREMHDVLAHRISLVAMHSGALAYRTDLSPEELRESSAIIRDNAHLALTELRQVLGVLRATEPADADPHAPQPTLADLPAFVAGIEPADGPIRLTMPDDLTGMSDLVSRNAFRIVQEGLTNRRKHSPQAELSVQLTREDESLVLSMRNAVPRENRQTHPGLPASGLGLVGAAERAVLAGGELTSGLDRGGDFAVRARLPWPRDPEEP